MIKTPKRHCGAMNFNYMPNFINVSVIVFALWPYNQSGTPARRSDNFSKSDNNTLRQILAEGKKICIVNADLWNYPTLIDCAFIEVIGKYIIRELQHMIFCFYGI